LLSADQQLCLAYARVETREALRALFCVDAALGRIALGAREPMMARIKLAWWREQGFERGGGDLGREIALLRASTDQAVPLVCRIAEGWDAFLAVDEDPEAALSAYAVGRGTGLFELGATVSKTVSGTGASPELTAAGAGWALCDLAFTLKGHDLAPTCLSLAQSAFAGPLPHAPLPLAILARLAKSDARRGLDGVWRAGSPMRILRAAMFAVTGR
jgi:15-cis-phytoene synthase